MAKNEVSEEGTFSKYAEKWVLEVSKRSEIFHGDGRQGVGECGEIRSCNSVGVPSYGISCQPIGPCVTPRKALQQAPAGGPFLPW